MIFSLIVKWYGKYFKLYFFTSTELILLFKEKVGLSSFHRPRPLLLSFSAHIVYIGNQNHHQTDIIVLDYNARLALIFEDTWRELSRLKVYSKALTGGKTATTGVNSQAIPSRGKSNKVLRSPALESNYKENLHNFALLHIRTWDQNTPTTIETHTHLSKLTYNCNEKSATHTHILPIESTYTLTCIPQLITGQ